LHQHSNMKSDTPRTDEAIEAMGLEAYVVPVEICRQLERELTEKNNEVARLRKYVEKLEIYSPENEWSHPEWRKLIRSKEEQEDPETLFKLYQFRFAPATEKTLADKCIGNVTKFTHEGNNDAKDKQPEWRELGDDEVICEGDERQEYIHGMVWRKCENSIGTLAGKWPTLKFRRLRG